MPTLCQAELEENIRLQQPYRSGDHWNFKPESRLEILNPYTVRFVFPELDGGRWPS